MGEGRLLARPLHFHKLAAARHHDVEVHLRVLVFDVGQIEQFLPVAQAHADRGDRVAQRVGGNAPVVEQLLNGEARREISARDRGRAGAPVGLQDVAVDPQCIVAELLQIDDGAERAADEALDLDRAAVELPAGDVARLSLKRAVGQHGILGRQPAAGHALLAHPRRHLRLDGRGADDLGAAKPRQHRTGGIGSRADLKGDRAHLVVSAAVKAKGGHKVDTAKR